MRQNFQIVTNTFNAHLAYTLGAFAVAFAFAAQSPMAPEAQAAARYPSSHSPGNVRADHYLQLFGGRVILAQSRRGRFQIMHMTRDGRYVSCGTNIKTGKHRVPKGSRWKVRRYLLSPQHRGTVLITGQQTSGRQGWQQQAVYNGNAGTVVVFVGHHGWHHSYSGHIQKRLPRSIWKLCPNFPSAKSLGLRVNEAQTATTYSGVVRQSKGQRILRPDLMTRDTVEYLNPAGKWRLRNGQRVRMNRSIDPRVYRAKIYKETRRPATGGNQDGRSANTRARRIEPDAGR